MEKFKAPTAAEWENVKARIAEARAESVVKAQAERSGDTKAAAEKDKIGKAEAVRRLAEWERKKRSDSAKKAAATRKENERVAEQVFAEIAREKAAKSVTDPTPEETEARCKEFLRNADKCRRQRGKDSANPHYGSYRMRLPDQTFKAYKRLRLGSESLYHFVIRLIDQELARTLQRELKRAYQEMRNER